MTDSSDLLRLEDRLFDLSHFICELDVSVDDPGIVVRYASAGLAEAIGIRRSSSLVGYRSTFELLQLVHPDDRDEVVSTIADAAARGTASRFRCRIVPTAGQRRFDIALEPGSPAEPAGRWRAVITDVTEWRAIEELLRARHDRATIATRAARIGVWEADMPSGRSLYDEALYDIYGLEKPLGPDGRVTEVLPGPGMQEWLQSVHPDDVATCIEALGRADRTLEPVEYEHRIVRPNGDVRHIRTTALMIADDTGRRIRGVGTSVDITERKRLTQELAQEKERLELALRAGRIGIWELDLIADTVTYWDRQLCELYGMPADSPTPPTGAIIELVHPDDAAALTEQWKTAMTTGTLDTEFRVVRSTGATAYIRSQAQVFYTPAGVPARIVGVNWDNTPERELTTALRAAKDRAEAAERIKSDFLAVMSHEIRTPLNTVIGMTQLALQTELTSKQRTYLGKVDASARSLLGILNDILDFSKIEAGRMELEQTTFTLESVLESVAAVNTMVAEDKGLEIAFAVSPGVPTRLVGDPLRLGQVLINLVNNAIKFTERGEVVVAIDLEHPAVDDRVTLRCEVRDTGIGLSPDQIENLFQAFSQAEQSVSRRYGGTGLGLAICQRLVELMGGRIWATSQQGLGSTFTFTFTAGIPNDARVQARTSAAGLAGRRVLIVDDNASARQILRVMVQTLSLHVADVSSAPSALRALKEAAWRGEPFDLVLMDWRMPGMDGLEAAERIKTDTDLSDVPAILMVTAYGREEVLKRAQQLGLNGVLIKPVTESVMFNAISDALSCAHAAPLDRFGEGTGAEGGGSALSTNERWRPLAGRKVLVVDDNALNREVVMEWLLAVCIDVDTAVDGRDALARLEQTTYDAVLMDVHMPEMDGLTATREIRQRPEIAKLPVIALTAQAQTLDREASLAAGMNAHLTKPIDSERLYSTLLEWLAPDSINDTTSGSSAKPGTAASSGELPASLPGIDLAAARSQLGGRDALLKRLLRTFVSDFQDAPRALDGHLAAGRRADVALLSHTVKSAAAYIGAESLSEAAAALEEAARHGTDDEVVAAAPAFRERLNVVLASIESWFGRTTAPVASDGPISTIDPAAVLGLITSAEPLVARGDYAVVETLDEIARIVAGTPAAAMADSARRHFDDLDLDAALADLARLGASLREHVRT